MLDVGIYDKDINVEASETTYVVPSTLLSGDGLDIILACLKLGVRELTKWSESLSAADLHGPSPPPMTEGSPQMRAADVVMMCMDILAWTTRVCTSGSHFSLSLTLYTSSLCG